MRRNEFLDHETDNGERFLPGFDRPKAFGEPAGHLEGNLPVSRSRRGAASIFQNYVDDGRRFILEVADELGTEDTMMALRITRAVLHAIRDRIPADDAVEFGQGLPMMIKAVYFDNYDISRTPVKIRSRHKFLEYISRKNRKAAMHDFREEEDIINALQAVFIVLEDNMDIGQVEQVLNLLPLDIQRLIDRAGAEEY